MVSLIGWSWLRLRLCSVMRARSLTSPQWDTFFFGSFAIYSIGLSWNCISKKTRNIKDGMSNDINLLPRWRMVHDVCS